jgi:hypothetical protein
LVLLHRPFALYEQSKLNTDSDGDTLMNNLSSVSRAICIDNTFKMVRILTQQFRRFDPTRFPQPQLQHIGTAVAALISATAVSRDVQERTKLLESLHVLADLARAISPTYTPAEIISDLLDNLLKEPGWGWKHTAGKEQELVRRFSDTMSVEKDGSLSGTRLATKGHESNASLPKLNDEFDFTFESDEIREMLSSFGDGAIRSSVSGGLPPRSTGLSQPPAEQTDAREELSQMSYEALASWTYATLGTNCGQGDSYDTGQYDMFEAHFDSML